MNKKCDLKDCTIKSNKALMFTNDNKFFCCQEHLDKYNKQIEEEEFDNRQKSECYGLVKSLLKYDNTQLLPRQYFTWIAKLRNGDFTLRKTKSKQGYSYFIIKKTLEENIEYLNVMFERNKIRDENGKLRYMFVVIENKINDVYRRCKKDMENFEQQLTQEDNKVETVDSFNIYNEDDINTNNKSNDGIAGWLDEDDF